VAGLDFDFTGGVFDGGDFTHANFSAGKVGFTSAVFSGGNVEGFRAFLSGRRRRAVTA
jgi:uncharacterized protein YjbI with pentapeptide repeats